MIGGSVADWSVLWIAGSPLAEFGASGASWAAVDAQSCRPAGASASRVPTSKAFRTDRIASNPMIACRADSGTKR